MKTIRSLIRINPVARIRAALDARAEAKAQALLEAEEARMALRLRQHRRQKRQLADALRDQHSESGEHPDYLVRDWQYEVANGYTRLGYWEWVANE